MLIGTFMGNDNNRHSLPNLEQDRNELLFAMRYRKGVYDYGIHSKRTGEYMASICAHISCFQVASLWYPYANDPDIQPSILIKSVTSQNKSFCVDTFLKSLQRPQGWERVEFATDAFCYLTDESYQKTPDSPREPIDVEAAVQRLVAEGTFVVQPSFDHVYRVVQLLP